jgi:hypothetical protein
MSEIDLMRQIQFRASELGHRLWRNNVGFCNDPKLRFGLCPGSSDLIGISKDGRFIAVEVKTSKGRTSPGQESFIQVVRRLGGIGIIARKVEDFNV